jgi:hypothetical protein
MRSDLEERAFNYAHYRGPPPGLCGAGAHPGSGVTGAPGHNAAREMLWELSHASRRSSAAAFPTIRDCIIDTEICIDTLHEDHARHQ